MHIINRKLKAQDNALIISDLQIPYHHRDAFAFLRWVKKHFKINKTYCIGDEVDQAFLSYHEKDPNGLSAKQEIKAGKKALHELARIFPVMDICWSNHGALHLRKAKTAGIPEDYIKSPNKVWGVPTAWRWFDEIVLQYPHLVDIVLKHNFSTNSLSNIKSRQCSLIQGHYHSQFNLICMTNHYNQLIFGATIGCLINRFHPAFNYANNQKDVQQLGVMVLLGGSPVLVPMWVDKKNRWIGPRFYKRYFNKLKK